MQLWGQPSLIAILAVLMHGFWPVLGQLRAAAPVTVQVICSVHGTMSVPADEAPAPAESKPACAMCSAAGCAFITDAIAPGVAQVAADAHVLQFKPLAPLPRALHSFPSPRAPPRIS
jgi:hypothetical protein